MLDKSPVPVRLENGTVEYRELSHVRTVESKTMESRTSVAVITFRCPKLKAGEEVMYAFGEIPRIYRRKMY